MKNEKSTENGLVVYNSLSLDLDRYVKQLQTPIKELNLETRLVLDDSMYAGGFYGIEFEEYGINGIAYIRFLKALNQEDLLEKIIKKLFGEQKADDCLLIEHNQKKYRSQWCIRTNYGLMPERLFYLDKFNGGVRPGEFATELKTRIANEKNILLSNKLLHELFAPLFDPLIQTYMEVIRY